jgi:hypothetical protein
MQPFDLIAAWYYYLHTRGLGGELELDLSEFEFSVVTDDDIRRFTILGTTVVCCFGIGRRASHIVNLPRLIKALAAKNIRLAVIDLPSSPVTRRKFRPQVDPTFLIFRSGHLVAKVVPLSDTNFEQTIVKLLDSERAALARQRLKQLPAKFKKPE